jgi:hypothetical protein
MCLTARLEVTQRNFHVMESTKTWTVLLLLKVAVGQGQASYICTEPSDETARRLVEK